MQVKGNNDKRINQERFKEYFWEKYLSSRYYDNKKKEFNELKLGQKFMEEHVHKFLELLKYVDYIKDERVNIQSFLSSLPSNYRQWNEFVNPPTLDKAIRMEMHFYEKGKRK